MFFNIKNISKIVALFIFSLSRYANAYSEAQLSIDGVFFPKQDVKNDTFNPFAGVSAKAEIMNNVGLSFGLGHTWSVNYSWVDARELYWINQHMYGFYFGLAEHLQYQYDAGFGAGLNLGYTLPLTYYINSNLDGEAGYGSSKFYKSIYDPFYFTISLGLSINLM